MIFDSKSYLYGEYCRVIKSFNDSDDLFDEMVERLGDFRIYPGSITPINDEKTKEKAIEFIPTIMDANISVEKYRLNHIGRYNIEARTPYSKISIDNSHAGVIYNGEGKAGYYSIEVGFTVDPCVYYYDLDAVNCLREKYNLSNDDIAKLKSRELKNLGFEPDNKYRYNVDKAEETGKMSRYLLHDYNDNINGFLEAYFDYNDKKL